jgi:hypothetical protein
MFKGIFSNGLEVTVFFPDNWILGKIVYWIAGHYGWQAASEWNKQALWAAPQAHRKLQSFIDSHCA